MMPIQNGTDSATHFVMLRAHAGDIVRMLSTDHREWTDRGNLSTCELWQDDEALLYEAVEKRILPVVKAVWGYRITTWSQELRLNKYEAGQGFPMHTDLLGDSTTKATFIICVQPADKGGGTFIVDGDVYGDFDTELAMRQGDVLILPGWVQHSITAVEAGTRISMTGWLTGPPFR